VRARSQVVVRCVLALLRLLLGAAQLALAVLCVTALVLYALDRLQPLEEEQML
jgi:hypothetical protein